MGANNSKAATAEKSSLKPTVSIGTPHPESLEQWKRESTQLQPKSDLPASNKVVNGQETATSAQPITNLPTSSEVPSSPKVADTDQRKTREPLVASNPNPTSSVTPTKTEDGLQKSGIRENPVFEDDTPTDEVRTGEASGLKPLSKSPDTVVAKKEIQPAVNEQGKPGGKGVTSPPAVTSKNEISSAEPTQASIPSKPVTSEIQPERASVPKAASPVAPVPQPQESVSGLPSQPRDSGPESSKTAGAAAAAEPVATSVPVAAAAASQSKSKKADEDKVQGGGCFGCFSPKEKEEKQTAEEKVAKPSIGTPTGFVAPVEGSTADSKVASDEQKAKAAASQDVGAKEGIHPEKATDVSKVPSKDAVDTSLAPKTPEKTGTAVVAPTTPEPVSQTSNLPSSVTIEAPTHTLESLNSPVVLGSGLFPLTKEVKETDVPFEEPKEERLTIRGDEDKNSVPATAALAGLGGAVGASAMKSHADNSKVTEAQRTEKLDDQTRDIPRDRAVVSPVSGNNAKQESQPSQIPSPPISSTKDPNTPAAEPTGVSESRIPKAPTSVQDNGHTKQTKVEGLGEAVPATGPSSLPHSKGLANVEQEAVGERASNESANTSVLLATMAPEVADVAKEHHPQFSAAAKEVEYEREQFSPIAQKEGHIQESQKGVVSSETLPALTESKKNLQPGHTQGHIGKSELDTGAVPLAAVAPQVAKVAHEHQPEFVHAVEVLEGENAQKQPLGSLTDSGKPKAANLSDSVPIEQEKDLASTSTVTSTAGNPASGSNTGNIALAAVPLAAVAPHVARVAHDHEPEFIQATNRLEGENAQKHHLGDVVEAGKIDSALGSTAPLASVRPTQDGNKNSHLGEDIGEKQAVAAALRHDDAIPEGVIPAKSPTEEKALQEAIQQQNVAKALREEEAAHHSLGSERVQTKPNIEGADSVKTTSTEDMSTLVEPGTPNESLRNGKSSASLTGTDNTAETLPEGSSTTAQSTSEKSLGQRKSRYVSFKDNPVYQASPSDVNAEELPATSGTEQGATAKDLSKGGEHGNVDAPAAIVTTPTDAEEEGAQASSYPASPFLKPTKSKKIEKLVPDTSPEALEKEKNMDSKLALQMQKSREREEKAKEKLRQKSLKKRKSGGFLGIFGGSSKNVGTASVGAASGAGGAAVGASQAATNAGAQTAGLAPQAATVPVQGGTSIAAPIAAGIGAGAVAGVATGAIASNRGSQAKTVPQTTNVEPTTVATPTQAEAPSPPVQAPPSYVPPSEAAQVTSVAPPSVAAPVQSSANIAAPVAAGVGAGAVAGVATGVAASHRPSRPKEPATRAQEPTALPSSHEGAYIAPALDSKPKDRNASLQATPESVPEPGANLGTPATVQTSGPGSEAQTRELSGAGTPVTPAELAISEKEQRKLKKAQSKKLAQTDFSAIHMAKTPSATFARKGYNPTTGVYDNQNQSSQPGVFSPMRTGGQQLQSTIALNRQQSIKRQPSIKNTANAAPIQSLASYEFKGPKAPAGRGIEKPEVSYARNYRPMSTVAGRAAPTSRVPVSQRSN